MDRMMGKARTRLWWMVGLLCALFVGLAGCGKDSVPVPKYGARPKPKTKPAASSETKAGPEKPAAPAEKPAGSDENK